MVFPLVFPLAYTAPGTGFVEKCGWHREASLGLAQGSFTGAGTGKLHWGWHREASLGLAQGSFTGAGTGKLHWGWYREASLGLAQGSFSPSMQWWGGPG